ncbi:MAG: hypothetical protein AAGB07_13690 [Pseudomonadota bacterium]
MTKVSLIAVLSFSLSMSPALSCIEECHEGEFYSDEAEMCVSKTAQS